MPSCDTSPGFPVTTTSPLSLTASTLTGITSPETCGSYPNRTTVETGGASATSKIALGCSRPVYDIAHAGPRNRFTILTASGSLVVHNCGYQGGKGAFAKMGANFGLSLPEDKVDEIVKAWRSAHPNVTKFWKDLELAAFKAVANAGLQVPVGKVNFLRKHGWLYIRLPSGRVLSYAAPKIMEVQTPFGPRDAVTFMAQNSVTNQWERQSAYGGLWTENVVQATSACLLRFAMRNIEAAGYPIVLTVHDEIVAEVPEGFGSLAEYQQIMARVPPWLAGCPIAAAGWGPAHRYRK